MLFRRLLSNQRLAPPRPAAFPLYRSALSTTSSKLCRTHVPAAQVKKLWGQSQAVCFDVDCTITKGDALDDLASFLGKGKRVREMTNSAMNGTMELDEALEQRLELLAPLTVDKLKAYIKSNPADKRLVPGIQELIEQLHSRNVQVYLISGGFRELILPIADLLKIPRENIFANRFVYMASDDTSHRSIDCDGDGFFPQIHVKGFDKSQPTSHEGGKPEAIRRIRAMKPLQTVTMVGDGITDLEAVQETGGADLFIGYGGVVQREAVKNEADWFVTDYEELVNALPRLKVAMVGSGAFASATMQMVAHNAKHKQIFHDQVDLWVHEEVFEGEQLAELINEKHQNPRYLPGITWGDNVVASSDLPETVAGADVIVFCAPHQFMLDICKQIQPHVKPTAVAISLTKGIHISPTGPQLMSSMINRTLNVDCSVMMGANLAKEIKPGGLCEGTIGSHSPEQGRIFQELFDTPYFSTTVINDVEGAELAGALKNVVALAAGFADGCRLGENAKAAIMRQGLTEMRSFAKEMYSTVQDDTFAFESCGVADLIATCYGGRNHRVAEEFAKRGGEETFEELEVELLNGQKLQGVLTSHEVKTVIESHKWEEKFPLFTSVNAICRGIFMPEDIARYREIANSPELLEERLASSLKEQSLLETEIGL